MSNKEKKNQAYNLLANEIRRLDYFKVFSDNNMLKIAYRIVNEKIEEQLSTTEDPSVSLSIQSMIAKHQLIAFETINTANNSTRINIIADSKFIPTPVSVKILEIVTAGFAKQVEVVKKVAAKIYEATTVGTLSGKNFSE